MKITEFDIQICKENVLQLIDCYEDSALYEEVVEEYEEMLASAYEKIEPVALLEFGSIEGIDVVNKEVQTTATLFSITSIGRKMSEWATKLFEEGDYLGGMLADAMADDYLFQMDHHIAADVIKLCKEKKCGVQIRLEAPQDISMEVQRRAWEVTKAEQLVNIEIKESFMYDPVKTTCQVYVLNQNAEQFRIEHNCATCANVSCKMRTVKLIVRDESGERIIAGQTRSNALDMLKQSDIFVDAVCNGRGQCGKCKIRVIEGRLEITEGDRKFFNEEQLAKGYRLACLATVTSDVVIETETKDEAEFAVVTDYQKTQTKAVRADEQHVIAIDIGTTTLGMQLLTQNSGEVIDTYTGMNGQRAYGADVISRIEASNAGKGKELQQLILRDLQKGINHLTRDGQIKIEKMVIGANTTMVHLLMGYSCETLGTAPFTPVNIDTIETEIAGIKTTVLSGISTYVGSDITAGMYALGFHEKEEVSVLIDLGTNGEMAIGTKERMLVTSTAAGPAFEGGNITCGTGSIAGAISGVTFHDGEVEVTTIYNAKASGICGTGVVEVTYELVKAELCDETGLLEEPYFEDGFELARDKKEQPIAFYQKDVREMQLAKSAVRAGLETLIRRYGVSWAEVEKIYVAGGFGYHINIEKAIGIGLLPGECQSKIEAVGNTCLKGACTYLLDEQAAVKIAAIKNCTTEVQLSSDKDFNEFYMEHMYF